MNLPEKYLDSVRLLLGDEFEAYIDSFNDSRQFGLRVNNLKISTEEFLEITPFDLKPIPWIENGFYFKENDKPAKHPHYHAGLYYLQEPSAMTPANVLPIEVGDKVFDMCAAPGGKSTELGAKLNGTGILVSNDISNSRAKALLKNIEIAGIQNSMVLSEDPAKLVRYFESYFDKILIDAPCSGEGMFRKDPKLIKSWEENGPEYYHEIQKDLLVLGADMLTPGGMMLYSTCTFSNIEDEESIRHLLKNRPDMKLADIKNYDGFSHGLAYDDELKEMNIEKAVRIWPHKMQGEGHFVVLLTKDDADALSGNKRAIAVQADKAAKLPDEFLEFISHMNFPLNKEHFRIIDDNIYMLPDVGCPVSGLRFLRTGLLLGESKKKRFEPSQALAMALKMDEFDSSISLRADDPDIIKYLKGETIEISGAGKDNTSGWQLICVDGFPLGWGKLNGTTLKNKYCAGWRWM